jgi:hypothetical protein
MFKKWEIELGEVSGLRCVQKVPAFSFGVAKRPADKGFSKINYQSFAVRRFISIENGVRKNTPH